MRMKCAYFSILYLLVSLLLHRHVTAVAESKGGYSGAGGTPKRGAPSSRWQPQNGGPIQQQPAVKRAQQPAGWGQGQTQDGRGDLRRGLEDSNANSVGIEEGDGGEVKARFPGDRVPMYTRKVHHRAAVALVAFASATALAMVLGKAIISKSSIFVALVFATGCFFSCYTTGDFSQFSNALGVGTILFIRKLRPRHFFSMSTRQLLSAGMLAVRRPFPPVENPWTCKDVLDASEVPFSMINSILSMVFFGMFLGYNITNRIPLFPGWIGGLVSSVLLGYTTTTRNTKGDLLRYLGHSINVLLSELVACADDVYLREKTGILLNRTFFFINKIDQRFGLLEKIRAIFNKILDIIRGLERDRAAANKV